MSKEKKNVPAKPVVTIPPSPPVGRGDSTSPMDDALPGMEQELFPSQPLTAGGSNPDASAHLGSDYNVISDLDRWACCRPGSLQCTVAGRLHCYGYTWSNNPAVFQPFGANYLTHLCLIGYRNGYCGRERISDDLQSRAVFRQSETLEVAPSLRMATEHDPIHLSACPSEFGYRRTTRYTCVGPGSSQPVCCVVGGYPSQLGVFTHAVPQASVHRCQLVKVDGEIRRVYTEFHWSELSLCNMRRLNQSAKQSEVSEHSESSDSSGRCDYDESDWLDTDEPDDYLSK